MATGSRSGLELRIRACRVRPADRTESGDPISDRACVRERPRGESHALRSRRTVRARRTLRPEANMAKLLAADASWEAANVCLQTHGGFGFAAEYDVERKFRETRLYQSHRSPRTSSCPTSPSTCSGCRDPHQLVLRAGCWAAGSGRQLRADVPAFAAQKYTPSIHARARLGVAGVARLEPGARRWTLGARAVLDAPAASPATDPSVSRRCETPRPGRTLTPAPRSSAIAATPSVMFWPRPENALVDRELSRAAAGRDGRRTRRSSVAIPRRSRSIEQPRAGGCPGEVIGPATEGSASLPPREPGSGTQYRPVPAWEPVEIATGRGGAERCPLRCRLGSRGRGLIASAAAAPVDARRFTSRW